MPNAETVPKKPRKTIPHESWRLGGWASGLLRDCFFCFFGTVTAFCNFGIGFIVFFGAVTAFCNFAIGFIGFIGTVTAF